MNVLLIVIGFWIIFRMRRGLPGPMPIDEKHAKGEKNEWN